MIPDSRPRKQPTIKVRGHEFTRIYCSNCGCNGGHIRADAMPFVFYLCEPCCAKYGRINEPEIPEALVRGV